MMIATDAIYRKVYYCLGYLGSECGDHYPTRHQFDYIMYNRIRTHTRCTNNGSRDRVPVATNSAGTAPDSGYRVVSRNPTKWNTACNCLRSTGCTENVKTYASIRLICKILLNSGNLIHGSTLWTLNAVLEWIRNNRAQDPKTSLLRLFPRLIDI